MDSLAREAHSDPNIEHDSKATCSVTINEWQLAGKLMTPQC
jgi:hypothetical protein